MSKKWTSPQNKKSPTCFCCFNFFVSLVAKKILEILQPLTFLVSVSNIFYFQPYFWENSHFDSYFSDGLVQPPTRKTSRHFPQVGCGDWFALPLALRQTFIDLCEAQWIGVEILGWHPDCKLGISSRGNDLLVMFFFCFSPVCFRVVVVVVVPFVFRFQRVLCSPVSDQEWILPHFASAVTAQVRTT